MKAPRSLEERFRRWVAKTPGITFGNLDYALKDPESIAYDALAAFKAGWKAAKADKPQGADNGS
jgi:hypothetical protein